MARKTAKKTTVSRKTATLTPPVPAILTSLKNNLPKNAKTSRWLIIALLVIILALLVWRNKGLLVAATVNGQPLWRLSLEQRLNSQYSNQTLDEMVGEMLIRQAAAKNKITVSKAEVDGKVAEIEKTLNGRISLQDALAQQGDTLAGFRQRVELQLLLEKLTAGQVTVSDDEINSYIESNKSLMTATDEAGLRAEAKQALMSQKQNTVLRQYFSNLQKGAKVSKFL